jgi:hypothetical protein
VSRSSAPAAWSSHRARPPLSCVCAASATRSAATAERYDEAIRLAGVERARVWRIYLRAARQGFLTGWGSVYQVLAEKLV